MQMIAGLIVLFVVFTLMIIGGCLIPNKRGRYLCRAFCWLVMTCVSFACMGYKEPNILYAGMGIWNAFEAGRWYHRAMTQRHNGRAKGSNVE